MWQTLGDLLHGRPGWHFDVDAGMAGTALWSLGVLGESRLNISVTEEGRFQCFDYDDDTETNVSDVAAVEEWLASLEEEARKPSPMSLSLARTFSTESDWVLLKTPLHAAGHLVRRSLRGVPAEPPRRRFWRHPHRRASWRGRDAVPPVRGSAGAGDMVAPCLGAGRVRHPSPARSRGLSEPDGSARASRPGRAKPRVTTSVNAASVNDRQTAATTGGRSSSRTSSETPSSRSSWSSGRSRVRCSVREAATFGLMSSMAASVSSPASATCSSEPNPARHRRVAVPSEATGWRARSRRGATARRGWHRLTRSCAPRRPRRCGRTRAAAGAAGRNLRASGHRTTTPECVGARG